MTRQELAEELAAYYQTDPEDVREAVDSYAGQQGVADAEDLTDAEARAIRNAYARQLGHVPWLTGCRISTRPTGIG